MKAGGLALALSLAVAAPAAAAVVDSGPGGFEVRQQVEIKARAAKVFDVMAKPGLWWSSDHTYSHQAGNMTLDARAGGCWCETWPGGSVEHMRVVHVEPGKSILFEGALGPLVNTAGAGRLQMTLEEKSGVTTVTWTYDFGGYAKGGLSTWAQPVDGVLTEAIGRLKTSVEAQPGR